MLARPWIHVLALALGLGCSDECHDIGCGGSLIVELAPEQGFEDGAYEVQLDSPEGNKVCSFVLAGGAVTTSSCTPAGADVDAGELPRYVLIRYHQEQPQTLSVAVAREGEELARQDLTPEYEEVWADPNACGGPCIAAQVSVAF